MHKCFIMGNQWSLYSWYTLPLFRVNSSVAFMRKGIYVARVRRILNLWRISKTSSTSWRSVCAGAFFPKVSAVLKKEWQYKNNQCQRSFLLSSNVDQSHSYLCPSPLLQWSCSHQRWQLLNFYSASKLFPGQVFDGTAYQRCSVGEGEVRGNINDDRITETSGLAYSRRSEGVDIHHL